MLFSKNKNKIYKCLSLLCTLGIALSMPHFAAAAEYRDVENKSWYSSAVTYVDTQGYMNGVGDGKFAPNAKISRAMMATVLYRLSGEQNSRTKPYFNDCKRGAWYFDGVQYCAATGIIGGYGDGKFGPDDYLTRQDMMTMCYRYAQAMEMDAECQDWLEAYKDGEQVRSYARNAVNWCLQNHVTSGVSAHQIAPLLNATRAQLAQILMNFDEFVLDKDTHTFYVTPDNPYGFAVQNIRLTDSQLSFTLGGVPADEQLTARVYQIVNGTATGTSAFEIPTDRHHYEYVSDAAALKYSGEDNIGKSVTAKMILEIYSGGKRVFMYTENFGKTVQSDRFGSPMYFKGEAKMDCRILLWHDFQDIAPEKAKYGVMTTGDVFEQNIQYLLENHYSVIPLSFLEDYQKGERALPQKSVIITIDDGYQSNYDYAYPILKKYNLPATIFVVVSGIETQENKMSWDEMREMEAESRINIQAHSWIHEDHSKLPASTLNLYYQYAFDTLEQQLGPRLSRHLAYPNGLYSDDCLRIAKQNRIEMQMTTRYRAIDFDHLDLSTLPRITVRYDSDMEHLCSVIA